MITLQSAVCIHWNLLPNRLFSTKVQNVFWL